MEPASSKDDILKRIVTAKLFMDDHFAEDLAISAIAEKAYFSKFHFLRLFSRSYGMTPYQYLTRLRIRKARELMQQGISVTKAMTSSGFSSISSFNKLFRRHFCVIPSTYLQRMRHSLKTLTPSTITSI
jgi:transcriptional regulator GlxA family with amidase domain